LNKIEIFHGLVKLNADRRILSIDLQLKDSNGHTLEKLIKDHHFTISFYMSHSNNSRDKLFDRQGKVAHEDNDFDLSLPFPYAGL